MELSRRIKESDHSVRCIAAHPGFTATNTLTSTDGKQTSYLKSIFFSALNKLVAQSVAKGAIPILYAATAPDAKNGKYYGPDRFQEWSGNLQKTKGAPLVYNQETATRLWQETEKLLSQHFKLEAESMQQEALSATCSF